jgi:hypothetical protein
MMSGFRHAVFAIAAMTIFVSVTEGEEEPQVKLLRNPFERPAIADLVAIASSGYEVLTTANDTELRGVLVAGSKSMVNFGGIILRIGESAKGYQLLSVEEGQAVFSRNDEKVVVSLYEQESIEER